MSDITKEAADRYVKDFNACACSPGPGRCRECTEAAEELQKVLSIFHERGRHEEREACAKIARNFRSQWVDKADITREIAEQIRALENK